MHKQRLLGKTSAEIGGMGGCGGCIGQCPKGNIFFFCGCLPLWRIVSLAQSAQNEFHTIKLRSFCRQFVRIHIAHKAEFCPLSSYFLAFLVLLLLALVIIFSCSDSHLNIYWFCYITQMHIYMMLPGVGDWADYYWLWRRVAESAGMTRPGRRQGRIEGGILEVLDQVVTDLNGSGKIREGRSREWWERIRAISDS